MYVYSTYCSVTECIVCVSGHDPLSFSFRFLFLFDWVGVLWPQLFKVLKLVRWAGSVPFPPVSLQRQVVCLLLRPVFISGESLHCFLVGANKSYVIATSDLWLFIHASNLLPSLPTPLPYKTWRWRAGLEVEESHTDQETV